MNECLVSALACPKCHQRLTFDGDRATCRSCGKAYGSHDGCLDFAPDVVSPSSYGQAVMESSMHVSIYENTIRPHFVRLMAKLWTSSFGESQEHDYIRRFLVPVDGPVLDLACGTGRWTETVAEKAGRHRTIGLDLSLAMLTISRKAHPDLPFIRGTGERLPFGDSALGAVNCWAAIQLMPSPKVAFDEIARCLRPGGTFTCFTFRRSPDPVYRYFQETHAPGLPVFRDREIIEWMERAGMDMVDIGGPELALLFTARRRG